MSNKQNTKNDNKEEVLTNTNKDSLPPDIFERGRIAEQMCQLIVDMNAEAISPLALDGNWGSGKSVHAERMKKCFEDKHADKIKCIYWNASAEDYTNEPILALIATLYHEIREDKKRDEYVKQALALITGFLVGSCIALGEQYINIQTGGLYNRIKSDNKLTRAVNSAKLLFNKTKKQEKNFELMLRSFSEEKERILVAKEIINIVRGEKELIIIIDELDRCRPDFALKMLESIKHLFATENCKFVLVMNKESMASSVEHLYGLKEEAANRYLSKYITRTFQLPNRYQQGLVSSDCTLNYFLYLVNYGAFTNSLVKDFMNHIIISKNLALRDVEKIAETIRFIQEGNKDSLQNKNDFDAFFACYAAYLFTIKHDLAMKLAEKRISISHLLKDLGWDTNPSKRTIGATKPAYIEYLEVLLDFYFASNRMNNSELTNKYPNSRIIGDIERYCYFFIRWMNYCSFMQ